MHPVPLRRRLLLLAAVAILPLALMSGIALQALLEQQRRQVEQSSLDLTRALATAAISRRRRRSRTGRIGRRRSAGDAAWARRAESPGGDLHRRILTALPLTGNVAPAEA